MSMLCDPVKSESLQAIPIHNLPGVPCMRDDDTIDDIVRELARLERRQQRRRRSHHLPELAPCDPIHEAPRFWLARFWRRLITR